MTKFLTILILSLILSTSVCAQTTIEDAEIILKRAIQKLGGEKYLKATTQIGRGNFTRFSGGRAELPTSFIDIIVFPDKERTEFKQLGNKTVQTNVGTTGWLFDGAARILKDQNKEQIENFRRGIRTSPDNLLRGEWRKENAKLTYVGRREAALGKRNHVVKLTYADGFAVEFEFSSGDGLPAKSIYKRTNTDNEEVTEEDRFAQFVEVQNIFAPFIIDHFQNGQQTSRINYLTIEFNKPISESIFTKPANAKDLKKDLKL